MSAKTHTRRFHPAGSAPRPLRTAVVGYGYWGPNLVRNVIECAELELSGLCERDPARAEAFARRVPGVPVFGELDAVLADPTIDAVVVATPPRSHYAIVKAALSAGKHVLVEKPLATKADDARDLIDTARQHGVVLMPGHTFIYSPSVNKVRDLIDAGELGELYFVTSSRMNLGKYQPDGVICDLAPHDISILLHWMREPIVQVSATARSVFHADVPETAFITLKFAGGTAANLQVSWLAPRKVRQMVAVGSRRMVQYDDTAPDESVRVYDRGMEFSTPKNFGEYQLTYRSGDIVAPCVSACEPLALELEDFARAISTGSRPQSDVELGLEVVLAMDAAEQSLLRHGEPVRVPREAARAVA